jgi:hypothetical protein
MALRTTIVPDQGPNFTRIVKGDLQATSDGIQLVWNRLLTDAYAYARTEDPNVFHKDQELAKVRPALRLRFSGDTTIGRYFQAIASSIYVTINANYDGANWQRDDVALAQWILGMNANADRVTLSRAPAGANPSTGAIVPRWEVDPAGAIYERGRAAAQGVWTNFVPALTSNGTGAVTVTGTNSAKTMLVGKSLTMILNVVFTMAGAGAGDNVISVAIPGGLFTVGIDVGYARIGDAGLGTDTVGVSFGVGTAKVNAAKVPTAAFSNGAGNTLQLNITLEIA